MPKPKHIFVIRLSAMGDVAMTVPVLKIFKATYPEVKITVLSKKFLKPLFNDIEGIEFMEADVKRQHKGIFGLLKLANEARSLGIDAVADLHNVIRSKVIAKSLSVKGVQVATIDKGRSEKKKLTQAKGMGIVKLKSTHQRYADVFETLGYPLDLSKVVFKSRSPLNKRLLTIIGDEPKKCIGIAPFAAYHSKMYPLNLMQQVLTELDATQEYRILLFGGGKKEEEVLNEMAQPLESVTNVAGTLTFEEELDLISNLDLMVSMDSGNGHLAAMYGIPVITLWGVTHPYAGFTPFGQPEENQLLADRIQYPLIPTSVYGNKYPDGYEKAMETIEPVVVIQKIKDTL
ncbi:MAG: glycosyltransferase family 9 protein [Flavobacteriaceae bacterium]|nr:glycosyltransferase family 9 protein [Flavobacteriaceae bacterium]